MTALLAIRDLTVEFRSRGVGMRALDAVSLEIGTGEILGLVGESGSGKSTLASAVLGLLPASAAASGNIVFDGRDVPAARSSELEPLRGRHISYVPQEPLTALNPTLRVRRQVDLVMARNLPGLDACQRHQRAVDALESMGIADAERVLDSYPFELSGGQVQRVLISLAIGLQSRLLIADEPTTALDVTVQAEVLDLIESTARQRGLAVLLITHNLGIVGQRCGRVVVMRSGRIVETGPVARVFREPSQPYTRQLLAALPALAPPRTLLPVAT